MTSFSAKALRTDAKGLAFLRAVLRRSPESPAPLRSIVNAFVEREPGDPNKECPKNRLAEAES
jgi:hypothetical protein